MKKNVLHYLLFLFKMIRKTPILFSIAIVLFIFSSCATILSGSRQRVLVETEPSGSRVFIDKKDQNVVTPCELKVKRKKHILFTFQKDGYQEEEKPVDAKFNPVVLGNIIAGGLIGAAVDDISGAWWKYENKIFSQLKEEEIEQPEITPSKEPEFPQKDCYTIDEMISYLNKGFDVNDKKICLYTINFETAKSTLDKTSMLYLDQIVDLLKNFPATKMVINGHTDNVGSEDYNITLSKDRALAVYNYLLTKGNYKERLSYAFYGTKYPIASNDSEEGKSKNRRVEFEVMNEIPPIRKPENASYTKEVQETTQQKGYIIEIEGTSVYVDYTSKDVKVGDRLQVMSEPKVMIHPVTKQKIQKEGELIATLEITETQNDYSVAGKIIPANAIVKLKVGDKVVLPLQTGTILKKEEPDKSIIKTKVKDISSPDLITEKKIPNNSRFQQVNRQSSLTPENHALDFYNRATEKLNSGDNKGAIDDLTKAIFLDRYYAEAYNNRGVAYQRVGRYNKAIRDYKAALKIKPDFDIARDNKSSAKSLRSERTSLIFSAVSLGLNAASATMNAVNSNNAAQPSYSTTTHQSNSLVSTKHRCGYCNGTGKCPYCNSAGQSKACVENQFGVRCTDSYCIAHNHKCKHCDGTHICSNCKGTGYK